MTNEQLSALTMEAMLNGRGGGGMDAVAMAAASKADGEAIKAEAALQEKSAAAAGDPGTDQDQHAGQANTAPDPDRYELHTLDDFSSGRTQSYYLKDLCPKSGQGQIFGESGTAKSFVALDMAYSLAIGRNWFKWKYSDAARKQLPLVVYLVLEGGGGFRLRVRALLQRERKNPDNSNPDPDNFVLCDEPFNILELNDRVTLVRRVQEKAAGRGVVLFIDTMAQAMPALDENSSQAMGTLLKYVDELQRSLSENGAFVWLISHMGKSGNVKQGSRGWSGQKAPMDMQIAVEPPTSKAGTRHFTIVKNKDGIDGITCAFILQGAVIGQDEDGDNVTSCTVEPTEDDAPEIILATPAQRDAVKWLKAAYDHAGKKIGEAISVEAWREACSEDKPEWSAKKVRNAIDHAKTTLQKKNVIAGSENSTDVILIADC